MSEALASTEIDHWQSLVRSTSAAVPNWLLKFPWKLKPSGEVYRSLSMVQGSNKINKWNVEPLVFLLKIYALTVAILCSNLHMNLRHQMHSSFPVLPVFQIPSPNLVEERWPKISGQIRLKISSMVPLPSPILQRAQAFRNGQMTDNFMGHDFRSNQCEKSVNLFPKIRVLKLGHFPGTSKQIPKIVKHCLRIDPKMKNTFPLRTPTQSTQQSCCFSSRDGLLDTWKVTAGNCSMFGPHHCPSCKGCGWILRWTGSPICEEMPSVSMRWELVCVDQARQGQKSFPYQFLPRIGRHKSLQLKTNWQITPNFEQLLVPCTYMIVPAARRVSMLTAVDHIAADTFFWLACIVLTTKLIGEKATISHNHEQFNLRRLKELITAGGEVIVEAMQVFITLPVLKLTCQSAMKAMKKHPLKQWLGASGEVQETSPWEPKPSSLINLQSNWVNDIQHFPKRAMRRCGLHQKSATTGLLAYRRRKVHHSP